MGQVYLHLVSLLQSTATPLGAQFCCLSPGAVWSQGVPKISWFGLKVHGSCRFALPNFQDFAVVGQRRGQVCFLPAEVSRKVKLSTSLVSWGGLDTWEGVQGEVFLGLGVWNQDA